MRVVLVFLAVLLSLGTLGVLGALAYGLSGLRLVTETEKLPYGVRLLTLDTGDIPLSVRLISDDDATEPRVNLRITANTDDIHLAVANEGASGRVTVLQSGSGFARFIRNGEIEVVLPPTVARQLSMTVNQQSGSLSAHSDLDQLVANTHDGGVVLGGRARRVDINLHHGDIRTSTAIAVSDSFRAATESGGISVDFRETPRTMEAVAEGDVTVRLPASGPYRVLAQSGARDGETTVTVPQTTTPSAPLVMVHSTGGSATVTELR